MEEGLAGLVAFPGVVLAAFPGGVLGVALAAASWEAFQGGPAGEEV